MMKKVPYRAAHPTFPGFAALTAVCALSASVVISFGDIVVTVGHNGNAHTTPPFRFEKMPPPSTSDAATKAEFKLIFGTRDGNSGTVDVLHDGKIPLDADQPDRNFFLNAGAESGRIQIDLGKEIEIKQFNSYSWHPGTRGPQVYSLYASDGKSGDFTEQPKEGTDPEKVGWKKIAEVDTRDAAAPMGGQYGVSISDNSGSLGTFRYLLMAIQRTESTDAFGNTFYSEIDVIERGAPPETPIAETKPMPPVEHSFEAGDGKYKFTIVTTTAPDLTEWADAKLTPVVKEWYPKLVAMLPSEGFEAPTKVNIVFRDNMRVPAATGGANITCSSSWMRKELDREAKGAVVHELVHVVQQYGLARRTNRNATRAPGWLTEGIPDYLRWFLYEPETHGAELTKRNIANAKYDAAYRVTGNFLNWVTEKYSKDIVQQLNAALRQGKYTEEIWKDKTGHTVQELGAEWKHEGEKRLGVESPASADSTKPRP